MHTPRFVERSSTGVSCIVDRSTGMCLHSGGHGRDGFREERGNLICVCMRFFSTTVSSGETYCRNITFLLDTKNGDGIEAWVNLTDEDMAKFETDKELLTYASPTI
ncbi:hypothetical protein Ddye_025671 [Dipteronia dyeriana]|uniref:Uncharacterized protein n=1 Tax=Dipteronia dyeriana TaxID=168575 RepID=A0AAD9WNR2_9ROSI|nr:hypothetical protein Ddye_025671 [Dipteronia dyeriana]